MLKIIGRFHSVFKLVELIRRLIGLNWRVIGLKCRVKSSEIIESRIMSNITFVIANDFH